MAQVAAFVGYADVWSNEAQSVCRWHSEPKVVDVG